MKVQTQIQAGVHVLNHNETLIRPSAPAKAGKAQTQSTGLKVQTGIKGGKYNNWDKGPGGP